MLTLLAGFVAAFGSQPANGFWKDIAGLDFDAVAQDIQNCPLQPVQNAQAEAAEAKYDASQPAHDEAGKHCWLRTCIVVHFMPYTL